MTGPPDDASEEELRRWVADFSAYLDRLIDRLDRRARAAGHPLLPGVDRPEVPW